MIAADSPVGANGEDATQLWRMVAQRLGATESGAVLLGRLRAQPGDQGRRDMASSALAQSAAADPVFQDALHQAVLGTPAAVAQPSINHQAVSIGGNVSGSEVANSIDKSTHRSTRIGTGGWIVAGLIALTVGGTTVVAATSGQTDPSEIGTERSEAGVREAAQGYVEAFAAKDGPRTCSFLTKDSRTVSFAENCAEYLNSHVFTAASADLMDKIKSAEVGEVEFFKNPNRADAHLVVGSAKAGELNLEYETGRWLVDVDITKLGKG